MFFIFKKTISIFNELNILLMRKIRHTSRTLKHPQGRSRLDLISFMLNMMKKFLPRQKLRLQTSQHFAVFQSGGFSYIEIKAICKIWIQIKVWPVSLPQNILFPFSRNLAKYTCVKVKEKSASINAISN